MKKSTLLSLGMLFGTTVGYSQVSIGSLDELKAAKDSVAKIATYQNGLSDAKSTYNNLVASAVVVKPVETTKTTGRFNKGEKEKTIINNFCNKVLNGTGDDITLKVKREISAGGLLGGKVTLHIYIPGESNVPDDAKDLKSSDITNASGNVMAGDDTNKTVSTIYCYVKGQDKKYTQLFKSSSGVEGDLNVVLLLQDLASIITEKEETYDIETTTKNPAYLSAKQAIAANETLQSYYNAALNGGKWTIKTVAWNDEETDVVTTTTTSEYSFPGCRNYTNLKLSNNIEINDAEFTMDIAEGYVFDGNGKTITGKTITGKTITGETITGETNRTKALFDTNKGTISNVVLDGCTLVEENEGKINNVTVLAGKNGNIAGSNHGRITGSIDNPSGTLYNVYASDGTTASVDGNKAGTYGNIYNNATLRNEFGVNVLSGIVSKGSDYKLYEVKAYSANLKEGQKRIVNIDANGFIETNGNDPWSTDRNGAFYYVTDIDAADFLAKVDVANANPNVVYTINGTDWKCKKATVCKGANDETPIYIHEAFEAESVTYARTFDVAAEGASTICLPFAVTESELGKILGTNGKLLQFNKIEENGENRTYWFKYVSGGMEANQPYILKFGEKVNGQIFNLENVRFNATGSANIAALEQSMEGVGASLCGTFKKQTASELEAGRYSIYGFMDGKFVRMTDNVVFKPTRAYVRREGFIPSTSSSSKSYKLGILDENDNEVTAINTVENAAGVFAVKGGNGVITVNSEKAQNVKVYTVGGALVKNVAVSAGEVSIPVTAGLYIVNGNKVVVK